MSPQETFNTVVAHLRKQGEKSGESGQYGAYRCLYRGPNGTKCAAGCLIPDDKYSPDFEYELCTAIPITKALEGHDIALVRSMQRIHDNYEVAAWETQFERIARVYSLTLEKP